MEIPRWIWIDALGKLGFDIDFGVGVGRRLGLNCGFELRRGLKLRTRFLMRCGSDDQCWNLSWCQGKRGFSSFNRKPRGSQRRKTRLGGRNLWTRCR